MAPTFRHGKAATIKLVVGATISTAGVATGGTTRDLSSGLTDHSIGRTVETADITTYGDTDRTFLAGLRTGTVTGSGLFASTYEDILAPLLGVSTGLLIKASPHGAVSGRSLITCPVILTDLSVGVPVGDKVSYSISFQRSGPMKSTKN